MGDFGDEACLCLGRVVGLDVLLHVNAWEEVELVRLPGACLVDVFEAEAAVRLAVAVLADQCCWDVLALHAEQSFVLVFAHFSLFVRFPFNG